MSKRHPQAARNILMVRPANFGFNEETAASNAFQTSMSNANPEMIRQKAIQEFDAFVERLRSVGVNVIVAQDNEKPSKPDAIFPNNWVSFHEDGTVVTYPMLSPMRRLERRDEIIAEVMQQFRSHRKVQLEEYETIEQYLEGTGSMVLDYTNKIAYACLSPRTHKDLFERFCKIMNYEPIAFHAVDGAGQEIYHTNVMMAVGETFVVICLDSIPDEKDKTLLRRKFSETKKEIIEITLLQMTAFAGNMLQLQNDKGETFLVMSETAYQSLDESQIRQIKRHTQILSAPIPTIETYGGGSVRCMMAEIFLPKK